MCVCVRECVRASARARAYVRIRVIERERERERGGWGGGGGGGKEDRRWKERAERQGGLLKGSRGKCWIIIDY